jgi:uncharacterized protein YceH (UPF0502 family)
VNLDPVEGRVVGSLIEKQLTTPQQYPLSLNSLTLACNQTSNRDPVTSYGEGEVQSALDSLKAKGLVRFVLPSHGRSVVRYRHVMDEKLALDARQMSLIGVLLLRGPQTVGELRTRTERMADFASLTDVQSDLEGLTKWEEPLVQKQQRRPGQKEERWAQLLSEWQGEEPRMGESEGRGEGSATRASLQSQIEDLRTDLEALREEVARLKAALGE